MGAKDKRRIGRVVMTLLTGVGSVVGLFWVFPERCN